MPIYAYRCESCGHRQDVLQKMSDPLLTDCPACGKSTYVKQVTAAGFQLKGSGWYVTDFRGGNTAAAAPDAPAGESAAAPAAPAATPAASPAPAPAPAAPASTPASGGA
jgi:putative FmdB family regulatory protein